MPTLTWGFLMAKIIRKPKLADFLFYNIFMETEIEAKFLNINKTRLRKLLQNIGAECVKPERMMRRTVFELPEDGSYMRVRDEGDKITMSVKHLAERSLEGMKEICLTVNSYNDAVNFLIAAGHEPKAKQETLRESWVYQGVEIDIDTWPWAPSFVEIEGKSGEAVKAVAEKLGFAMKDAKYGSVEIVYKQIYNLTDDEINNEPEIIFDHIPQLFDSRRRETPLDISEL